MQSTVREEQIKGRWEALLEKEGLPRELPEAPAELVQLNEEVVGFVEEASGGCGDERCFRHDEGVTLLPEDYALAGRIKDLGWAAALGEVEAGREQVERLADAGVAYLRAHGKRVVLAMAGATGGDVRRAAARAEYRERGTVEEPARGPSRKEPSPEVLAVEAVRRVERRGGALEERTLRISLRRYPPRLRRETLALLAERGEARRLRCRSSGKTLVVLADAPKAAAGRELRRVADLEAALGEERREALKPHASEVERVGGKAVAEWLFEFRRAVAGRGLKPGQVRELIRTRLPFRIGLQDALGEDAEIEEWRRSRARRREENAGINRRDTRAGFVPRRFGSSPEPHWIDDPDLRRRIGAQLRTGRAAHNTARAVYLASLPTLAHKVLHLLRRDGRRTEERFLALAAADAAGREDPQALLGDAIRALGEAGKVWRLRSRATGRVYLEATEGLDEATFARSLRWVVRSGRYRIPVPEGRRRAGDSRANLATGGTGRPSESAPKLSPGRLAITP